MRNDEVMSNIFKSENAESTLKAVAGTAESKIRELQNTLHDAETRIGRLFDDQSRELRKRASLLADETSLAARRRTEDAKLRIREHPIESVAVGLGIGLLLGLVIGFSLGHSSGIDEETVYIEE